MYKDRFVLKMKIKDCRHETHFLVRVTNTLYVRRFQIYLLRTQILPAMNKRASG